MVLSKKHRRFVEEYLVDLNATQAAIRAKYAPTRAKQTAHKIMQREEVQEAIAAGQAKRSERTEITQDRVLQEFAKIAFADMADFLTFNADGTVTLDWSNLPEGATKVIQSIEQDTHTQGKGDDATKEVLRTKFKLHDKLGALRDIGRHLGMFTDNVKHSATDEFSALLKTLFGKIDGNTASLPVNHDGPNDKPHS